MYMPVRAPARIAIMMALVPIRGAIAQTPQPPVTLRVNTQLVQVSVVVRDSHGDPVGDLKQSDFEVYDNGKRQEIRVFTVEDYRTTRPVNSPLPAPATPAVTEFSNRNPIEPGAPNAPTVIAIDAGDTWDRNRMTWPDLIYARDQLILFLRQVHPEDRLGIYLMGADRFWVLREYNQNCADLLKRLATWKSPENPDPASAKEKDVWAEFAVHFAGVDAETAKAIHRSQFWTHGRESSAVPEELPETRRSAGTAAPAGNGAYRAPAQNGVLGGIEAVARHLAAVPGRKNIILISGKLFLPMTFKERLEFLRPIIQAGVAVYTIDPGGLAPYALDASFAIPSKVTAFATPGTEARAALQYLGTAEEWKRRLILMLQASLIDLAEATGGKAFVNTNDIRGAIHGSLNDSRVSYTLGFYPKTSSNDGSFHPIKVKIPGRDRLILHCRDGYFEPAPPQRDPHRRERELQEAVWTPVDATAIELSGTVSSQAEPDDYDLKLRIGLASVSLRQIADRWEGQIEVSLFQRDNSGNAFEPVSNVFGLKLMQESYERSLKSGFQYGRRFRLDPKTTSLRIVVRDLGSGSVGTLTIPFSANIE
jgi:VWFA-related protein